MSNDLTFPTEISPPPLPPEPKLPSVKDAFVLYALGCVLLLIFGSLLQEWRLFPGLIVTEIVLVAGPPLLYAYWYRHAFRQMFALRRISFRTGLLTVCIAGSAFVMIGVITALQMSVLPQSKLYQELWEQVLQRFHEAPFFFTILVVAVLPGLCEEILFRGFLLRSLRGHYSDRTAILVVGVLFGLFHVDPYRFLPTTLLGVLFGYLVARTGSLFPAMLAHVANNTLALTISSFALRLQERYPALFEQPTPKEPPSVEMIGLGMAMLMCLVLAPVVFWACLRALPRTPGMEYHSRIGIHHGDTEDTEKKEM